MSARREAGSVAFRVTLGCLALAALAACHARLAPPAASQTLAQPAHPAEGAYRRPPVLTAARVEGARRVRLYGWAEPGTRVRLASPRGEAVLTEADRQGVWRLTLAAPGAPQIFGLSMIDHGRTVQSEGYVVMTPGGGAAQLRAGAGAVVLTDHEGGPAILALDFDTKGGAVVSGQARARSALEVWADAARVARGEATSDGRFSVPLDQPLTFTDHQLQVRDGTGHADALVRLVSPTPLPRGPYRATATPAGWRIDWMTPGGGLQTTLLLSRDRSLPPDRGTS